MKDFSKNLDKMFKESKDLENDIKRQLKVLKYE